MSDVPDRPHISSEDFQQLATQLADQTRQLGSDLAIELHEIGRDVASEIRTEVDRTSELALGELQLARQQLLAQGQATTDDLHALGSTMESRLLTVIVIGNVVVVLAIAATVIAMGSS